MRHKPIKASLEDLIYMQRKDLLVQWKLIYGGPPPKGAHLSILRGTLCWQIQLETQNNDAHQELMKELREFRANAVTKTLDPGTELLREWKGVVHRVIVLDDGYEYLGETYRSLTAIAHKITSTGWPGPKFFGLRK